jgi:hypothetical protein
MIDATTVAGYDPNLSRVDNLLSAPCGMHLSAFEEMSGGDVPDEPYLALEGFHLVDDGAEALDDLQLQLFLEGD